MVRQPQKRIQITYRGTQPTSPHPSPSTCTTHFSPSLTITRVVVATTERESMLRSILGLLDHVRGVHLTREVRQCASVGCLQPPSQLLPPGQRESCQEQGASGPKPRQASACSKARGEGRHTPHVLENHWILNLTGHRQLNSEGRRRSERRRSG